MQPRYFRNLRQVGEGLRRHLPLRTVRSRQYCLAEAFCQSGAILRLAKVDALAEI
jgi:hypothetical protein